MTKRKDQTPTMLGSEQMFAESIEQQEQLAAEATRLNQQAQADWYAAEKKGTS